MGTLKPHSNGQLYITFSTACHIKLRLGGAQASPRCYSEEKPGPCPVPPRCTNLMWHYNYLCTIKAGLI